ncbi:hypothetical protein QFZ56_000162 [Streptomyces achromogenes]|uniref:Uncharacterized protein n=1 Tax=Streptomyces achromogenes TaxID=67255 RepID=A0ABU0PS44_STRAH|nr:hypothetical protein [Streptomyces achromogenes]MDQ0681199.1 hypothetical protein [Streptomyces achromogenes]
MVVAAGGDDTTVWTWDAATERQTGSRPFSARAGGLAMAPGRTAAGRLRHGLAVVAHG